MFIIRLNHGALSHGALSQGALRWSRSNKFCLLLKKINETRSRL